MTGKTHVAIGVAAALTLAHGQPVENQLALVIASSIGSLTPDLDYPKAKLNQKLLFIKNNLYRALFYLSLGSIFMYLYFTNKTEPFLLLGIVSIIIGISSHRSFTHSIIGVFAFASIVKLVTLNYGLKSIYSGFLIGYILHLAADFLTPQGIMLFYPLKINVSSPVKFKLDKRSENIIFTLLSIYSIGLLLGYLQK